MDSYPTRRSPTMPIKRHLDMHVSEVHTQKGRSLKPWIKAMRENLLDIEITDDHWEEKIA